MPGVTDGAIQLVVAHRLAARAAPVVGPLPALGLGLLRGLGVRRRLVAQGTGNTPGQRTGTAGFLHHLLTAHRRQVRVVHFVGLLHLGKVHVCRNFGTEALRAQDRLENGADAFDHAVFQFLHVFQLSIGRRQILVHIEVGQQIAALVHYRDVFQLEFGNAERDQIGHRPHLIAVEAAAGIDVHEHRRRRLAPIADKGRFFRRRQMHPGAFHRADTADGAGQFAFQAAFEAGVFHELAGAQGLFFLQHLETEAAVRGHPGTGQFQPGVVNLVGDHQQRPGLGVDLVLDLVGLEDVGHISGVHLVQIVVQGHVVLTLGPEHHPDADRHTGRQADHQADLAQDAQRAQPVQQIVLAAGGLGFVAGFCGKRHAVLSLLSASGVRDGADQIGILITSL